MNIVAARSTLRAVRPPLKQVLTKPPLLEDFNQIIFLARRLRLTVTVIHAGNRFVSTHIAGQTNHTYTPLSFKSRIKTNLNVARWLGSSQLNREKDCVIHDG